VRAAAIVRVSTEGQGDGHSPDAQRNAARALCVSRGWDLVREYEAIGESASTWDLRRRPSMQQAITDAEAGLFDLLIVHESSRLARNERAAHEILDRLTAAGVRLVDISSADIDYLTPEGRMFFAMGQDLNAYWSRKMSQHIRKGYSERHADGLPTGDIPFGYQRTGLNTPPAIVPQEAEAIRAAFHDYAQGKGYLAIAGEWNRAELSPHSKRGLTAFTQSAVQSVIENRFYAGVVTHRGHESLGAHEPIITDAEWQEAAASVHRHGPHKPNSYAAMLAGLPECLSCGGPIWSHRSGTKRRHYYFEPSRLRGRECPAAGRKWRVETPDGVVAETVQAMRLVGDWLDFATRQARKSPVSSSAHLRASLLAEKKRATNAYVAGALPEQAWWQAMSRIDASLAGLPPDMTAIVGAGERLSGMAEAWDLAEPEERNGLCKILFGKVRMDVVEHELLLRPRAEFESLFEARRLWGKHCLPPTGVGRGASFPPGWYAPHELIGAAA
jgi:DNA invertase Pin-like site-specific DNA recombinase